MERYKEEFIQFLLDTGALKFGEFRLKSGRIAPYFFDAGVFCDARIYELGKHYASTIATSFDAEQYDVIFGPAYKGIPLAVATVIALQNEHDINKRYLFDRKKPKTYGEATKETKKRAHLVGELKDGDRIIILDDVITTGGTKFDSINLLSEIAENIEFKGLVIAIDRQEVVDESGKSAVENFEEKTGIPVYPILKITDVLEYLFEEAKIMAEQKEKVEEYLLNYGTEEAKKAIKRVSKG